MTVKTVPKMGTAGDMDEAFDRLSKLTVRQAEAMAAEAGWANDWRTCPDPWATSSVNEGAP